MDLRSPVGVVKIAPRARCAFVQSRFYQISTVGLRTFFPENFGQAYSASEVKVAHCALKIYLGGIL